MTDTPRLLDGPAAAADVTRVLCEAFAEYPVMRYVLGDRDGYAARLHTLIAFFVGARVLRGDAIVGISAGGELRGVALCTLPDTSAPPALDELRDGTWAALGVVALERYDQFNRAWALLAVAEPNIHVNMLGVPPRFQGHGLGRALLERVHVMSREREDSRGVTLTTESEANVAFYRHLGYRVVGRQPVAPGLETWGFFRPDGFSLG